MSSRKPGVSPTRTYVAVCNKTAFNGYYCRQFKLPERDTLPLLEEEGRELENNTSTACWFFLNRLDFFACVELVIPAEEYNDLTEVK